MKKILLIVFIAGIAFLGLGIVLIMNSSVQKTITLTALESAGMKATAERISLSLGNAEMDDVKVTLADGTQVELKALRAAFSLTDIVGGYYNIESIKVDDIVVKIPATTQPKAQPTPKTDKLEIPFNGIFNQVKNLNMRFRLGELAIRGKLIQEGEMTVNFDIQSKGISSGTTGAINYTVTTAGITPNSKIPSLKVNGAITTSLNPQSQPTALGFSANMINDGNTYGLTVNAEARESGDAEKYNVTLNRTVQGQAPQILAYVDGGFTYANRELGATYKVNVDQDVVKGSGFAPEKMGDVNVSLSGGFKSALATLQTELNGVLKLNLPKPEGWDSSLKSLGPIAVGVNYAAKTDMQTLSFDQLSASVASEKAPGLLNLDLARAFTLPLKMGTDGVTIPPGQLATLKINLPLALANALPTNPVQLAGALSAVLDLSAEEGKTFKVKSTQPLNLNILSASLMGMPLLEQLALSLNLAVVYSPSGITATLKDTRLMSYAKEAGVIDLHYTMKSDAKGVSENNVNTKVSLNLSHLFKQPALASYRELLPPEELLLKLETSLTHVGTLLKLHQANVSVAKANIPAPLLSIRTLNKMDISLAPGAFDTSSLHGELVEVSANSLPLALLAPFIKDMTVSGDFAGKIIASADKGTFTVKTTDALKIAKLSVVQPAGVNIKNLNIATRLQASHNQQSKKTQFDVSEFSLADGDKAVAGITVCGAMLIGDKLPEDLKASIQLDLAALKQLIALPQLAKITSGNLKLDATLKGATQSQINATVSLTNVASVGQTVSIQSLTTGFNGGLQMTPFTIQGKAPLTLTSSTGVSDINIDLKFGDGFPIAERFVKIVSTKIIGDDFMALANAFTPAEDPKTVAAKPAPTAEKPAPAKPTRDKVPFWEAIAAKFDVQSTQILFKNYEIKNLTLDAVADAQKFNVSKLTANVLDAPFALNGIFTFDTVRAKAYDFKGKMSFQNLSLGKAFNISNWIDGLFFLEADANGDGDTLASVMDQLMGGLSIKANKGTLYFVDKGAGLVGSASGLISQGGAAVDTIGSLLGVNTKSITGVAKTVSNIAGMLQNLKFINFDVLIKRGVNLDLVFERIRVDGDVSSLNGTGKITHQPGVALTEQPLSINLQLGAKGILADGFKELGMLAKEKDDKGYYNAYTFPVAGTLAKPDFKILNTLKDLATKLIPGGNKTEAEQAAEQKKPKTVEDVIKGKGVDKAKDLLKGLF